MQKGEGYFQLKPVYVISILNHTLNHDDECQWDSVPDEFSKDKRICAVMNACEFARFDADKKLKFELEMLNEFDRDNHLRQEREKGLQEGLQQGRANRTVEIVRKMLSKGYSFQEISDLTGLSSDEISALKE